MPPIFTGSGVKIALIRPDLCGLLWAGAKRIAISVGQGCLRIFLIEIVVGRLYCFLLKHRRAAVPAFKEQGYVDSFQPGCVRAPGCYVVVTVTFCRWLVQAADPQVPVIPAQQAFLYVMYLVLMRLMISLTQMKIFASALVRKI